MYAVCASAQIFLALTRTPIHPQNGTLLTLKYDGVLLKNKYFRSNITAFITATIVLNKLELKLIEGGRVHNKESL